ncbi:hypothetical protein Tco_0732787 [Tanacetum coccineum]
MDEEQRAQIARDEEIARQWDEEERQRAMSKAKSSKKIDWNDPSVIRYHALKMKPKTVAQNEMICWLWEDLHIYFEPDEEDEIWKNQHEYNVISWSLCDFSGIHILLMRNGIAIHMLTEKKYPLSQEMLSKMLSKRLEVDHEKDKKILSRRNLGFKDKSCLGGFVGNKSHQEFILPVYERNLCYDEEEKSYVEAVIFINKSYKQQFNDYVEIKRNNNVFECDTDMEYHPSNVKFAVWMDSKFSNHSTMDWYMKNALWIYWIRGDDEEVLIDKVLSDLEETYVNKEDEIAEIFRIETNIFDFKTPLCKAFNEFNYLLKIDMDLLTHDIPRFKTYEEYKTAWIHEWNEDVPGLLMEHGRRLCTL